MYQRLHALKARILVVSLMFLASACVIQRANDQSKTGDEPVQPATPASKAEPEKAQTAVAAAPGAKPQSGKTSAAKPVAAAKPTSAGKPAATAATRTMKPAATAATPTAKPVATAAAPVAKPTAIAAKPAATVLTPAATSTDKGAAAPAASKYSRVSRYVGVENLNVRSRADAHAPIVGRLARGSMITVSVDGTWAKIGDSQFVAVKHLTKTQPQGKRLVSRK